MVVKAINKPSDGFKKAHDALIKAWECLDQVKSVMEFKRLLDEVATFENGLRKKHPSLSTYQTELYDDLDDDQIMLGQSGMGVFKVRVDPWVELMVHSIDK